MAVEVREARPEEYDRVGRITVAAYAALDGPHVGDGYYAMLRDAATRAQGAVLLVAVESGSVLGSVTYAPGPGPYAEFEDPTAAGIRMLAVDPAGQGRGAGAALVRACIERAQADGRSRILLHSTPWMTTAHRIYERAGFRRAAELDLLPAPEVPLMGFVLELGPQAGGA